MVLYFRSFLCLVFSYEACPESIQPFRISLPWCNLAASQKRPYCSSVNCHSPVGLVSRQWDAVHWACVLFDRRIHNDLASRSSRQCACPFYSSRAGFFFWGGGGKASHHPGLSALLQHRFGSLRLLAFPKSKIAFEREEIFERDSHAIHKLSQRHLTADSLASRESYISRMYSMVLTWLAARLHQGHVTGCRDIQNGCILSVQPVTTVTTFSWFTLKRTRPGTTIKSRFVLCVCQWQPGAAQYPAILAHVHSTPFN